MHISGLLSAVITGLVIGALGRLAVPGRQALGCFLTILIGIVGAVVGAVAGQHWHLGLLLTIVIQVVVAAVLVAIFAAAERRRGLG